MPSGGGGGGGGDATTVSSVKPFSNKGFNSRLSGNGTCDWIYYVTMLLILLFRILTQPQNLLVIRATEQSQQPTLY